VAAAAEVGAATVALMAATDLPGPALVTDPAVNTWPTLAQQAAALDAAQQSLQWALRLARSVATDAATDVRRAIHGVRELDREAHYDQAELAARRRRLAGARLFEQQAAEHSKRSEREVDAFRARAEAARASYQAAIATRDLHADAAAAHAAGEPQRAGEHRAAAAAGIARAALSHLQVLLAEAPRLVRRITDGASTAALAVQDPAEQEPAAQEPAQPGSAAGSGTGQPDSSSLAPGLLELRADPLGSDIRLLFALEPADTVTVLAVLEGDAAVRVHRDKALGLASDLLAEIRSGQWPPPGAGSRADTEVIFDHVAAYLDEFFGSSADAIRRRATARARADTLAGLRRRSGVSLADLAEATGISAERLWFIEDGGLRVAHVHEAAAYVRALGGQLDLTADLGAGPARLLF
jgi:hypothetical protein